MAGSRRSLLDDVRSIEGSRTFLSNIVGDICQVVGKLMTAAIECASDRLRDPRCMKRKMRERDHIVISAMIENETRNSGKSLRDIGMKLQIFEVPTILVP